MTGFRYYAVVAADPTDEKAEPLSLGQISLEYQPQLEGTICVSRARANRMRDVKSDEPYNLFIVDDIVLCDELSGSTPFNAAVLILRPVKKDYKTRLVKNLSAAKRTTR